MSCSRTVFLQKFQVDFRGGGQEICPHPPPPGKSQVAVGFIKSYGTGPLAKAIGPSGPVADRGTSVIR